MSCLDPDVGRNLISYELKQLSPAEEELFEAHLLQCTECYENLVAVSRVGHLLRDFSGDLPRPAASTPRRKRVALALVAALVAFGLLGFGICSFLDGHDARGTDASRNADAGAEAFQALRLRAEADVREGRTPVAIRDYLAAGELAAALGMPAEEARAFALAARYEVGNLLDATAARAHLERALERALASGDPDTISRVRDIQIGFFLFVDGDFDAAHDLADRMVETAEEDRPVHSRRLGTALMLRAIVCGYATLCGDDPVAHLESAGRDAAEAVRVLRQAGDPGDLARALVRSGQILTLRDRDGEGREAFAEAIALAGEASDHAYTRILALLGLAAIELRSGDAQAARSRLAPVPAATNRVGSKFLLMHARRLLGAALARTGEFEAARLELDRARGVAAAYYPTPLRRREIDEIDILLRSLDSSKLDSLPAPVPPFSF